MDIIKSILHVFKKNDNAFKVMHPETESACITDWNAGIVNTLASTGLSSLVNVLSSDSLLALLIKKVFDAMGVKYSLGQNGYVCWGALFGGVITQWGSQSSGNNWMVYYPLVFSSAVYGVWLIDYAAKNNKLQYAGISESESALNGFKMYTSSANDIGIAFLAVGR
nr:MAG TPA_asm: Putative tail fiber protein fold, Tail fiber, receptor [Caudoviricetes sp.]